MVKKKQIEEPELWVEEQEEVKEVKKAVRKRTGAYSKNKGSSYERQIVNELKVITGNENLCTARSESKKLDNMKIDIADPDKVLPFYVQCKKTQTLPSVKKLNNEVGKKDKPLAIFWNAQELKEGNINITSQGEYVIITKKLFYELFEKFIKK